MSEIINRCRSARFAATIALLSTALGVTGCSSLGASGPSSGRLLKSGDKPLAAAWIKVIDVDANVARRVSEAVRPVLLSDAFGAAAPSTTVIGPGDVLDISILEAPPAVLFSGSTGSAMASAAISSTVVPNTTSRGIDLPQQMVETTGRISIPFAGSVLAVGRSPSEIARDIETRLHGKAHLPQVVVRRVTNASSTVTVIGDVGQSGRIPLTSHGERLLDIIAGAGGLKQGINKSTVQITRGTQTISLPVEQIVRNPLQNVVLESGDVVAVYFQPFSFTALGAIGNNAEINFESTGLTLAQALGRIGGLQDNRANIKGLFIFRFEDPATLDPAMRESARLTPEGKVPVIYRVDLSNPGSLFVAQTFPIKNKDIIYVSNAPLVDLTKFVNVVSGLTFTLVNVRNALP